MKNKNLENQKPRPGFQKIYKVGAIIGPFTILEEIKPRARYKVKCNNCGKEFEICKDTFLRYKNRKGCTYCDPLERKRYVPGDIIGPYELLERAPNKNGMTMWKVRCTKCGKEQIQSTSNMKVHSTDKCSYCDNPNAFQGSTGKFVRWSYDELFYNWYKSRILAFNKNSKCKHKDFELTLEQFSKLIHDNCAYCGAPPEKNSDFYKNLRRKSVDDIPVNGIDRIDSNKGYVVGNCVPCCTYCNRMKFDMPFEKFKNKILTISERIRQGLTTIETIQKKADELK